MRTEEDLRDALATLERHAPRTARVLPAGRRGHRLRLSRGSRWLAGVTTAAALAGVMTVLTVPGAAPAHIPNGRVASLQPPAPATLRAKLLAAFSAASGQIVYEHSTWATTGGETSVMDGWYYPWQARKGQLVRSRRLVLNADGTPYQDVEFVYQMPSPGSVPAGLPSAQRAKIGRLTGVVAAMGEIIDVEYGNRTWSDQKDHLLLDSDPGAPVAISARVAAGHWWSATPRWAGTAPSSWPGATAPVPAAASGSTPARISRFAKRPSSRWGARGRGPPPRCATTMSCCPLRPPASRS